MPDSWRSLSLVCFANFLLSSRTTSANFVRYIDINKDGSVANGSNVPSCDKGQRISLESYYYLTRTCLPGYQCITRKKGELSVSAELCFHEACSMREICQNLKFPVLDVQTNGYDTLFVQYQCLGSNSFLDMCTNTEQTTDKTVHLIANDTATAFKECECQITGLDCLTLTDVRLKENTVGKCSPAALQIRFDTYTCNDRTDNFGSVFKRPLQERPHMTSVLFATRSRSVAPEMVWLIVRPNGMMTISCESVPNNELETTTSGKNNTTQLRNITDFGYPGNNKANDGFNVTGINPILKSSEDGWILVIMLAVMSAVIVLTVVIGILVHYRQRIKTFWKEVRTKKKYISTPGDEQPEKIV